MVVIILDRGSRIRTMKKNKEKKQIKLPLLELNDVTIDQLLKAGVHFGHRIQRWNPSMKPYIYTVKDGIHIIDLVKTVEKLNEAIEAIYNYASRGEVIFVSTKPQHRDTVKNAAINSRSHFVINRWPGGLLTNYMVTRKSIKKLNDYVKGFREGIENRTKKELLKMKRELKRLDVLYGGVKMFNKRPACLVVVDPKKSNIAVKEAKKMNIPVVALADSNAPIDMIDHVIPANDDAVRSVELIINRLSETISLANRGIGPEYYEISFEEIDEAIRNMSKKLEEKRLHGDLANKDGKNQPRVIRVTREQAKKLVR